VVIAILLPLPTLGQLLTLPLTRHVKETGGSGGWAFYHQFYSLANNDNKVYKYKTLTLLRFLSAILLHPISVAFTIE